MASGGSEPATEEARRSARLLDVPPSAHSEWRAIIRPRTVLTVLALGFAVYLLLPQVGELRRTLRSLGDARWWLLPLLVAVTSVSYLGAALSLVGSALVRLPLRRTVAVTLASSFADKLAPGNLGSLGLINAYVLRAGAPVPAAAAAVSLDAISGLVVHAVMLVTAALVVRDLALPSVHLPRHWRALLAVVVVLVLASVILAIASRHRDDRAHGWAHSAKVATLQAARHFVTAVRDPRRAALILGGSTLITASQVASLYVALEVFEVHASVLAVIFVYLLGSALASAAPTPGGLGAMEAALVAGLTSSVGGITSGPAVTAVLLYRLATYWLPILPGFAAYRLLRSAGRI